jgi:thioredoxin 1
MSNPRQGKPSAIAKQEERPARPAIQYDVEHLSRGGTTLANLTAITPENFETEVLKASVPVVVDFWAPWCGPCRMVAPTLEALAADLGDTVKIVKLNVDENQALAARFGVMSIPTIMLFNKGERVDQVVGNQSRDQLKTWIAKHQ